MILIVCLGFLFLGGLVWFEFGFDFLMFLASVRFLVGFMMFEQALNMISVFWFFSMDKKGIDDLFEIKQTHGIVEEKSFVKRQVIKNKPCINHQGILDTIAIPAEFLPGYRIKTRL